MCSAFAASFAVRAIAPAMTGIALAFVLPALAFGLHALFGDPAAVTRDAETAPPLARVSA